MNKPRVPVLGCIKAISKGVKTNKHCVDLVRAYLKFALRRVRHLGSKVTRVAMYSI